MGFTLQLMLGFFLFVLICGQEINNNNNTNETITTSTEPLKNIISNESEKNEIKKQTIDLILPKTDNSKNVINKDNQNEEIDNLSTKLKISGPYNNDTVSKESIDVNLVKKNITDDLNRKDKSRSIDVDINKYVSPDFHNKNNVYTLPISPETEKFINPSYDYLSSTTVKQKTFDDFTLSDLTTPKTDYFDNKFRETVDSLDQKLEHIDFSEPNESKEQDIDINKLIEKNENNKNVNLDYVQSRHIEKNENGNKNGLRKDSIAEQATKLNFESSYNDTKIIDEPPVKENDLIDVPIERNSSETSTIKNLILTTRKSVNLTKPTTSRNNSYILNNKIETESLKTTDKPKEEDNNNRTTATKLINVTKRGSIKFSDTLTTTPIPKTSTIYNRKKNNEQTVQENQIVAVHVDVPENLTTENVVETTTEVTTTEIPETTTVKEETTVAEDITTTTELNTESTIEETTTEIPETTTMMNSEETATENVVPETTTEELTTIVERITTEIPTTTISTTTEELTTSSPTTTEDIPTTTVVEQEKPTTTEVLILHIEKIDNNHTTLHPETVNPSYNYPIPEQIEPKTETSSESEITTTTTTTTETPTDEELTDTPSDNSGTIAAIIISSVGAVCLIILAGLLYIMRKRQKRFNYGQRCRPVSLDDYSVDNVSVYNSVTRRKGATRMSKRSYGNPAFDDPVAVTHPLNFPALAKFATNFEDIKAEYDEIPQITARTSELPEGCEEKNRYANVIPLPETRVFLKSIEGYPNSDYINANYVTGPQDIKGYYIACQGPMQNTVDDFWRMVWEQQSKVILMMTHLFENGIEKCADYLPPSEVLDCHRLFGDFQVTLKKREVKEKYIISSLQLKNMVSNSWREVTHFWYLGWPEKGVPKEANSLIAFLIEARSYMKTTTIDKKNVSNGSLSDGKNELNPVVVHCSPGTGRTGVVIACDIAIREFEKTRLVDIPKIVYRIRRDRASSVQTREQYEFIYKVVSLYATKLTGGALDSI